MEFTGERVIPDDRNHRHLYYEHLARYAVSQAFVKGKRVLDVGCGTGYGSAYLVTCGAASVVGIDLSMESVEYARANFQFANLSFGVSDATKLPFEGEQFDVCVSFEVIEHIADDVAFLEQIRRVLNSSGLLFISTPNKQKSSPDTDIPPNPFHVREYTYDALYRRLSAIFPYVQILGQHYAEGFRFRTVEQTNKASARSLDIAQGVLPYQQTMGRYNGSGKEEDGEEPDYFLAMCSLKSTEPLGVIAISMAGMDTVRRELAERNNWVAILQDEKASRDQRIEDLEGTLVEREKWIAIIQHDLATAHGRIADLENTLQDRENWIQILIDEKEVRDSRISDLVQTLRQREAEIDSLASEAVQRAQLAEGMRTDLESLTTLLKDRESQLNSVETHLSDIIMQLGERDRKISEYEEKLISRVLRAFKKGRK